MRVTRTRVLALVIVAGAAVFVGWRSYQGRALEHRLGRIASEIAGRDVRVECQGAVGAAVDVTAEAGSVTFDAQGRPADVTQLKRNICKRLQAFERNHGGSAFACVDAAIPCRLDTLKTLHALQTLAHEAWHLAGDRNEAITECHALQTVAYVARELGASAPRAHGASIAVLAQLYPQMPAEYRSQDCRDGGPLDLRPETTAWP